MKNSFFTENLICLITVMRRDFSFISIQFCFSFLVSILTIGFSLFENFANVFRDYIFVVKRTLNSIDLKIEKSFDLRLKRRERKSAFLVFSVKVLISLLLRLDFTSESVSPFGLIRDKTFKTCIQK